MYLIDTDILIYSLKGDPTVVAAFEQHADTPKAISAISYAELLYGAQKSQNVSANTVIARRVGALFPVLAVKKNVAERFGALKADFEEQGARLDDFDLLIAATALSYGLTLVSNNTTHFQRISDLTLENWAATR